MNHGSKLKETLLQNNAESGSDPDQVVDHKLYGSRAEFDATIDHVLEEFGVELVCLAGFMRILTGTFVKKWTGMKNSLDH